MTTKFRLLTRNFDLTVEGETVTEVGQLLDLAESRGLYTPKTKAPIGATADRPSIGFTTEAESVGESSTEKVEGRLLESFDTLGPTSSDREGGGSTGAPSESREIFRVIKRDGNTLVLSPKFPVSPDGSDRDKAAMVLLGAYDANGEIPITGSRLLKSLKHTGYNLERVDRQLDSLEKQGLVLTEGIRRGRKYRLSEAGRVEARKLALELSSLSGQPAGGGQA